MKFGLVCGYILLYRRLFPGKDTTQKSYEEKKEELKKKLKRTYNFGENKEKRQISYNITFGLKCYEKKGYICKRNKNFTSDCSRNATYNQLHQKAREYYHIPESSETCLATFYGKEIETGFRDVGTNALAQKEIKKGNSILSSLLPSIFVEVKTASNEKRL